MEYIEYGVEVVKNYVDKKVLPGAAISFVTKDSVDEYYLGNKTFDYDPIDENSLYDLASITKPLSTTVLILKLIEEGLITFETKVATIFPDFPFKDINIMHLLTHTPGITSENNNYSDCKDKRDLWQFLISLKQNNPTGTVVEYSCFSYLILGIIIEYFKNDIEEYAEEVLFKPLELDGLMYNPKEKKREKDCVPSEITSDRGLIKGVVHDGKANILNGKAGNAGLFGNLKSVSKVAQLFLNDGKYKGKSILKKETIDLLKKPYTQNLNLSRTIGWIFAQEEESMGLYHSDCCLYHTGFTGTSVYIDYIRELAIIFLTNAAFPTRDEKMIVIRREFHNSILEKMKI
ncbi:MAG: serine hydrolase domain-containing protein [Erysipelotrichaceae bacterium]|jgi:CubicO group peptidase (beta-lactamase class C family)|nr:beta-lactamase family protein [Erysipelotrichia bacterium]